MARIANLTSNHDNWGNFADKYLKQWKVLAINNDTDLPHTTLSYGDKNSHGEDMNSLPLVACLLSPG